MSEHKLPDWIYVPELEETITAADSLEDFLSNNTVLMHILNNINEGISILTPDFTLTYLNSPMKNWYGGKAKLGMKCYQTYQNRKKICENCPVVKALETGSPCGDVVPFDGPNAPHGGMHVYATPIRNSSGQIVLILEYVQNISFQNLMLQSNDDLLGKLSVLEAQNKLLLKNLAVCEDRLTNMEKTIRENIELHVRPALDYLRRHVDEDDYQLISSIFELSFYPELQNKEAKELTNLTARELQIANMIKTGESSKEIASKLLITTKAVDFHRRNIRKKLGIDSKTNLQVYLQTHLLY